MEVPALPESGARPYNATNVQLFAMFDIPGARERHQSASIPGTNVRVEMMEVQDVEHRTHQLRIQDPGAATLVFLVRDVDAVLARAKQAGAAVATPSGKPVSLKDGARAVLVKDIDGRFIELRQPASLPADAAATDIVKLELSLAVADIARATSVYRDVLAFSVQQPTARAADADLRALTGLAKAEVRRSRMQAPNNGFAIELVEYHGVDSKPLQMRIQDRGAARIQVRAENLDELVETMKAAGLHVVSECGVAVPIPPNFKGALVADPNGLFLTAIAPCDGCAPRLQSTRTAPQAH
jgi:catechol 2,3-dioxygenase-like lactoylglutathione lyase family enzyme